ncbi:peptide chain release factor N(5)-glutamine methyltransferase [Ottowia thiooxydans]|uniref:Release factor glutamine methyltransferase n=1 Tax=Ottowia thiooxydans TaxID=219182 RepID=A0ABV2QER7_9BURK
MTTQPLAQKLAQALAHAQDLGVAREDARILMLHSLGRPLHERAWLVAHDTDTLPPETLAQFKALLVRRINGEPVAYLTGRKPFYGLELAIDSRVLDPRDDTETLIDWALSLCAHPAGPAPLRLLDLGTGSGAIALALRSQLPEAEITAIDQSEDALAVASENAHRLRLPVRFLAGSWFAPVAGERFNLILSNPPYISENDPHLQALQHEPREALVSGSDGLDDIRHLVAHAASHLVPGGWLLMEHGWDQAVAVRALLMDAGFEHVQSRKDLAGTERCTGGCMSSAGNAPAEFSSATPR